MAGGRPGEHDCVVRLALLVCPLPLRALGMEDTVEGVWEWALAGIGLWRNDSVSGQHDKGGMAVVVVGAVGRL